MVISLSKKVPIEDHCDEVETFYNFKGYRSIAFVKMFKRYFSAAFIFLPTVHDCYTPIDHV